MTIVSERRLKRTLSNASTIQDQLQSELTAIAEERGESTIYITIDELAARISRTNMSTYQSLHRLEQKGMVEVIKEKKNNVDKIVGVKINKAADTIELVNMAVGKAKEKAEVIAKAPLQNFPEINRYMNQKEAVAKAKQELMEAGIEEDKILIDWESNPVKDEALTIFLELIKTRKELLDTKIELLAANRKIEVYERRYGKEPENVSKSN